MTTLSAFARLPFRPTLAAVGFLTLAACSSSGGNGAGGGATTTKTGSGGETTTTGTTTTTGSTCPPGMTYGGGEITKPGGSVTAKIVDETGAALPAGQPVYICGINLCSPAGMTNAMGSVQISTTLMLTKPAFKVGDAINYAEIAIPLTAATTDLTAGGTKVINTAKLADAPGVALTPGMSATSGDVTLAIPANDTVGIDLITYETPDQQLFHAVSIPVANEGPWLAASGKTDFALLYGVTPSETTLCPAVQVTVALPHATMTPNDLGWAPGAAVEFWMMTTDTGQTYAPYAGWAKQSGGTVSADGKSVTTTDGFIFLESFAIRLAQ
jgi:hypothetical protein